MPIDQEIRTFEEELQRPIRGKLRDAASLKEILRDATQALEKSLEGLPADIRDGLLSVSAESQETDVSFSSCRRLSDSEKAVAKRIKP